MQQLLAPELVRTAAPNRFSSNFYSHLNSNCLLLISTALAVEVEPPAVQVEERHHDDHEILHLLKKMKT